MYESLRKDHFTKTYTAIAMVEGVLGLGAALYFRFVSKNWYWLILGGYFAQVVGSIAFFFFPESPRYLVKSG